MFGGPRYDDNNDSDDDWDTDPDFEVSLGFFILFFWGGECMFLIYPIPCFFLYIEQSKH